MDNKKQYNWLTIAQQIRAHPAHIWIGEYEAVANFVHELLSALLCSQKACKQCGTCLNIREKQHHLVMWLTPEKQYTLDVLEPLIETIAFKLEPHEDYFFILQKAETLTHACANRLLKILEEPPHGYHFILTANTTEAILPTIKSRCLINYWHDQEKTTSTSSLFNYFCTLNFPSPTTFLTLIEQEDLHERAAFELIDNVLRHWMNLYTTAIGNKTLSEQSHAHAIITLLKNALSTPPMSGSSKLFLKNLYLQLMHKKQ